MKRAWFIRAGNANILENRIEASKAIALGWSEIGDLSVFGNRNEFIDAYHKVYPGHVPGKVVINAGQLFRFVHEVNEGDYVITPLKTEQAYLVGIVVGNYEHNMSIFSWQYPHIRHVDWKNHIIKQKFSPEALRSMGSILTVFNIDPYFDEIVQLVNKNEV